MTTTMMVAITEVVVTICPIGVPDVEDAPLYFQPVEVGVAVVAVDLMDLAASAAAVSVVLAVVALVVAEPEEAGKT